MRLAQRLAIRLVGGATVAPSGHVVGVHLAHLVDALGVVIVTEGAQRAVRGALRLLGLPVVHALLGLLVEDPHV